MTREELVERAKLLANLQQATDDRTGVTLAPVHLLDLAVEVARAFVTLAAPEWKDKPESHGLYWIDCYGYCTLTTVAADGVWAWTHGLKQPIESFKGAEWAKAELPIGPKREAGA